MELDRRLRDQRKRHYSSDSPSPANNETIRLRVKFRNRGQNHQLVGSSRLIAPIGDGAMRSLHRSFRGYNARRCWRFPEQQL